MSRKASVETHLKKILAQANRLWRADSDQGWVASALADIANRAAAALKEIRSPR